MLIIWLLLLILNRLLIWLLVIGLLINWLIKGLLLVVPGNGNPADPKLFPQHLLLGAVLPPGQLIKPKIEIVGDVGAGPSPRLVALLGIRPRGTPINVVQVNVKEGHGGTRINGDGGKVNLLWLCGASI